MHLRSLLTLILLLSTLHPAPIFAESRSKQETLAMRRIAAIWKDRDYPLVEQEGNRFLQAYPNSPFTDTLRVILGDAYRLQGRFQEAFTTYEAIQRTDLRWQTLGHRLEAAFHRGYYDMVLSEEENLTRNPELKQKHPVVLYLLGSAHAQRYLEAKNDEERNRHLAPAQTYLHEAMETPYRYQALDQEAQLAVHREKWDTAADAFRTLAYEVADRREHYLLRLGQIEAKFMPDRAVATLQQVQLMEGPLQGEASFLQAAILGESGRHQELLKRRDDLSLAMPESHVPLFRYLLARAHYFEENYAEALDMLTPVLAAELLTPEYEKTALLIGIRCAEQLGQFRDIDTLVTRFEQEYPEDPQLAKALFLKAQSLEKVGKITEAIALLDGVARRFPDFKDLDVVAYLKASFHQDREEWQQARKAYQKFVVKFPGSKLAPNAYTGIAHATLKIAEQDPSKKPELVTDIKQALNHNPKMEAGLREQYYLALTKTLFELQRYPELIEASEEYVYLYKDSPERYRVHFLLALTYFTVRKDLEKFIEQGELVLQLKPDLPQRHQMLQNLAVSCFQVGMEMGEEAAERQEEFYAQSAQHLFTLLTEGAEVQQQNLLWLANYYVEELGDSRRAYTLGASSHPDAKAVAEKGIRVYQAIWDALVAVDKQPLHESKNLHMERHLINWSALLGVAGRHQERVSLLDQLHAARLHHPDWPWQHKGMSLYCLAQAQESLGKIAAAAASYQPLLEANWSSDPLVVATARLQWARHTYALLRADEREPTHPKVAKVLKQLEQLATRRVLNQEPIHLEASIDRAMMSTRHLPKGEREVALLKALQQVKVDFTQEDDLWARDYHRSRQAEPQKDKLYQAYMLLLDGQIAFLQGVQDAQAGRQHESAQRVAAARSIFGSIAEGRLAQNTYLSDQARIGLNALESKEHFAGGLWEVLQEPRNAPKVN